MTIYLANIERMLAMRQRSMPTEKQFAEAVQKLFGVVPDLKNKNNLKSYVLNRVAKISKTI